MRVLLDIERDGEGRITGLVSAGSGAPLRFCGWLELLGVLEDHADGTDGTEGRRTWEPQRDEQAP